MNEKINKFQSRLFNKLFATLPGIRKFSEITNKLNLDEPITHFYSQGFKKFWFAKGEKENKFIFIFCIKDKPLKDITQDDATLIIDFDKEKQFNNDSLGLFSITDSQLHILINYDILKKRHPYFNTGNFNISNFKSIDNKLNLNVIDLGSLDEDFIENIEKLIKLSSVLELVNDTEENIDTTISEKNTIDKSDKCEICFKNKDDFKINSNLKKLKNLKPELCGKCIEKIVASEFYTQLIPLLKGNETKGLDIAKEKYGNDEIFDIGLKLLEKYDIIKYIGIKKLFFVIDKNSYLVSKYIKYSDANNLLIDNISKSQKETKKIKQDEIDSKNTNITDETTKKMNLFLNALTAGKNLEQSYTIAKINHNEVENWYELGRKGNRDYIQFYNKYKAFRPENKERMRKMEKFLDALTIEANIEKALKESDLSIAKVRAWYSLGEKGNENFKNFYFGCKLLLPNGIPKKETKKIVNNEELMNEFIALIENGKTNDEAITQLKIPKFKVKNWFNQGKLGNKKYTNFYNAYMIEIEKEKQLKKAKKQKKLLKKEKFKKETSEQISIDSYDEIPKSDVKIYQNNEKTCKLCGRKLSKKTKKEICKRCLRKQYASKILLKLLKSIEPEKPFKKEDLKVLDLHNIQITDYIWTLKEFNLLTEENNKLKLKNKNELENFIKESGLEIDEIPQGQSTVKLNKTCKTCGETLEISKFFTSESTEDGFEDDCKDCKRLIITASYLKEIIEFVDYESEFTEDELKPYFKNPMKLQGKIWALLDNDLIKKNFERSTYTLTDEKTVNEFLDKYYEEKPETKKEPSEEPLINHPKKLTKKDQMDIIIQSISDGKTRTESAEIVNIPLYKINHWYTEGRQGYGKDNVNFYKQLKRLEDNDDETKRKEYKNKAINRRIFLDNFKNGRTKEESAIHADLELSLVHDWYLKGKNDEKPYTEFYKKYIEIKNKDKKIKIPKIEKTDQFGSNIAVNQMNIILEALANGKSEKEAINEANISENTYIYWLNRGKQEFGELYTQFYYYVNKLKSQSTNLTKNENNYPEGILTKLPKEIEDELKKFSKGNVSGFAWTNKIGNHWSYERVIDGERIKIIDEDITKLYEKVRNDNLTWGVRDLEKAKKSLNGDLELSNEEIDSDIYAPLPTKYEDSFKSSPSNQSGIAWVNRTGNKWNYSKSLNGEQIKIFDENIYELHKKVKNENHIWGIRDYSKARKIIKIPDDFQPPKKIEEKNIIYNKDNIDPDIYAPLPRKYDAQFNPSQANKTGIAWVNKYGLNWTYSRMINGKKVSISDFDIYKLHKKVKDGNLVWGIKDYDKAKKIINIPNDFKVPEYFEEEPLVQNTEILAPLPKRYLSSFNPNQPNKTGIAWVNPVGNKWVYQRKVNGIPIKFSDFDIRKLHEVVIKNNHVWGIIDYDKAEKIINTNSIPTPKDEITSPITSRNVTVTYIEKSENDFDIIIKGFIKNEELINVLNRLKLFEKNIKRIITNSINSQVDIFIELELNIYSLKSFEEKIEDLRWKNNR